MYELSHYLSGIYTCIAFSVVHYKQYKVIYLYIVYIYIVLVE